MNEPLNTDNLLKVYKYIKVDIIATIIYATGVIWVVIFLTQCAGFRKDDTDGAGYSGLKPHIDNKTGCQYLSVAGGGVTPRLDRDGNHLGCKFNRGGK